MAAAVKKIPPLGWLAIVAAIGAGAYAVFGDGEPSFVGDEPDEDEDDDVAGDISDDEAA